MPITTISLDYETLPLADLHAPKAFSSRDRARAIATQESIMQDLEDAKRLLKLAGLWGNLSLEKRIDAREKYMVEMRPGNTRFPSLPNADTTRPKAVRKPHYSYLLACDNILIFQAACCLPLKIVAASLNGNSVSGRVLFASHSEELGGKLVYQFQDKGTEMIIDVQRGESLRAQRYLFSGM